MSDSFACFGTIFLLLGCLIQPMTFKLGLIATCYAMFITGRTALFRRSEYERGEGEGGKAVVVIYYKRRIKKKERKNKILTLLLFLDLPLHSYL